MVVTFVAVLRILVVAVSFATSHSVFVQQMTQKDVVVRRRKQLQKIVKAKQAHKRRKKGALSLSARVPTGKQLARKLGTSVRTALRDRKEACGSYRTLRTRRRNASNRRRARAELNEVWCSLMYSGASRIGQSGKTARFSSTFRT